MAARQYRANTRTQRSPQRKTRTSFIRELRETRQGHEQILPRAEVLYSMSGRCS
ncbi:hypothetical protein BJV77DRAFT_1009985 [Russula vinacea]|nr:hypothetical protein BJV77DRAFT_1009985 [Russula vinacea]